MHTDLLLRLDNTDNHYDVFLVLYFQVDDSNIFSQNADISDKEKNVSKLYNISLCTPLMLATRGHNHLITYL